jgi:hypothetical protein
MVYLDLPPLALQFPPLFVHLKVARPVLLVPVLGDRPKHLAGKGIVSYRFPFGLASSGFCASEYLLSSNEKLGYVIIMMARRLDSQLRNS